MLMLSRSGTFLRKGGLSFVIFTKYKEGVRAIQAIQYKKYVAGNILAHVHLWRGSTQIGYLSQNMADQV